MLQVSCQPAGSAISVFLLTCKCKHSEKFWQKILFLSVFDTREMYFVANSKSKMDLAGSDLKLHTRHGYLYCNAHLCITQR